MVRLVSILLAISLFVFSACAPEEKDEAGTADQSVTYTLRVNEDSVFGFARDSKIGTVWFSDAEGLVGSRIRCVVQIPEIARFQEATLMGTISLDNTNAIKDPNYLIEFDVDSEKTEIEFYIPQILAIPTYLNFDFNLYYEEENTDGGIDVFQAGFVYVFKVNQGTPAT